MQIPSDSDWDLGTYYTFSQHDLDIINNHRRDHNRLGFAVQLAVLRFPGWSLSELKMIPDSVLIYIAKQVGIEPDVFPLYAHREPTRREYMEEIRQAYGYRNFTLRKYTPTLLKSLEFRSTKSAEPLMKAIDIIRDMNETGKRKVPEDAPFNFVSNPWQKHIYDDDGTINRHYYEMAVLTELIHYSKGWNGYQKILRISRGKMLRTASYT
jgi:hypothetical protein